jgi:hypothetical protein
MSSINLDTATIFDLSMYDCDHGNFFYQLKYIQL